MRSTIRAAVLASTALTASLLLSGAAFAQSTATQQLDEQNEVEELVVTAGDNDAGGVIVVQTVPKSRASIDQEFIATQSTGQSILANLNLTPGLNYTNNDPYGSSGGNLRLRGFDGNRISLTVDGIPLNDTGNYAIFGNQQIDPELIDRADVNLGTTDVDSPTASAVGGTINYITRTPGEDFGGIFNISAGENRYGRVFGLIDSGAIGPFGTRTFASASFQEYDKWRGPGDLQKLQLNAGIYQPIGAGDDFIRVVGNFNRNRNTNYRALTLAEYNTFGRDLDFDARCNATGGVFGNCTNYYRRQVNPSNTASIRGQSVFTLREGLRLTVDPSVQYTLADGGGQLGTIGETDARLRGANQAGATGFDLNGNGTTNDATVAYFNPSVTQTYRWGLTSSLLWEFAPNQVLRAAYTIDYGQHRQTGEAARLDPDGGAPNFFGGKNDDDRKIFLRDGSFLRGRDRFSIAQLQQAALEYRGRFVEERLLVNAGLRLPFFRRELNQFCYSQNGSSNVICSTEQPVATLANGNVTLPGRGTTQYIQPFEATRKYDKVLPNIGASYDFGAGHKMYVSYAKGFSAPRTDSLYTVSRLTDNTIGNPTVEPETSNAFDLGYRFNSGAFIANATGWYIDYKNRIVNSLDPDLGFFVDRNVGGVEQYGFDAQVGFEPIEDLTLYLAYSYNHSRVKDDLFIGNATAANAAGVAIGQPVFLDLSGKQLVETPEHTVSARAEYRFFDALTVGIDAKYVDTRFSTDFNDQKSPAYTLVNLDARLDLERFGFERTKLQLNVINLFDEDYLGSISSQRNAITIPANVIGIAATGSNPTYQPGAPRTAQVTLQFAF